MIDKNAVVMQPLSNYLTEYKELNSDNLYKPVAVGRYGIRKREDIYSKELAKDYSKNRLIYKGTLTVGMGSVQIDIGILSEDETYSVSPAYHTYKINNIDYDYLRFCLQCRNADMFTRYVKRGSRQGKTIDLKRWINYKIPVYPIEMQLEIVDRINRVLSIKDSYQQELSLLDSLIKSRFVKMLNKKENESVTVEDLCTDIVDCPHTTPKYDGELINPAIRTSEIKKGFISWDTMKYVSDEEYKLRIARLSPEAGDIVYGREGTFGNAAILPSGYRFCLGQRVMLLRPNYSICTSEYLLYALLSDDVYRQAVKKNNASTVAHVNVKDVKQFRIPLPSLDKQNEFSEFLIQVDKSRDAIQKSLDETQLLFDSLMQEYFG